jgi:type I restriction enzyme M protein
MLRNNMNAAECKHFVLGLIFLKYISDYFEELYKKLENYSSSDPEDRDEYIAEKAFWVPKDARWKVLMDNSKMVDLSILIDNALDLIKKKNAHSMVIAK